MERVAGIEPARPAWKHVRSLHYHDIDHLGAFLCPSSGIVEPLQQAMHDYMHHRPDEMAELAEKAIDEESYHLAWRLYMVVQGCISSVDEQVSQCSRAIIKLLEESLMSVITESIKKDHG